MRRTLARLKRVLLNHMKIHARCSAHARATAKLVAHRKTGTFFVSLSNTHLRCERLGSAPASTRMQPSSSHNFSNSHL